MSNDLASVQVQTDQADDENAKAAQVEAYLLKHREFFVGREHLLENLTLPHESGKAVSLLERQVAVLRNRSSDTRARLSALIHNARNNDALFETTRQLVLALVKARNTNELFQIAQDRLSVHDNIDACEIVLRGDMGLQVENQFQVLSLEEFNERFSQLKRLRSTFCGAMPEAEIETLFPAAGSRIRSTALCPVMHDEDIIAVIAIGNKTDKYFTLDMDTLFLDFIADVIASLATAQLESSHSQGT